MSDFHQDGEEATIRLTVKGGKRRLIGIQFAAAEAIAAYLQKAGLESGPLFRARLNPRSRRLGSGRISTTSMYRTIVEYFGENSGGRASD